MRFVRTKVDSAAERNFLTALIIDGGFYNDVKDVFRMEYLNSEFSKIITRWCFEYHDEIKEAPGLNIQIVYDNKKHTIKQSEAELIETFLSRLSQDYEDKQEVNKPYILQQTLEYFRLRAADIYADKIKNLVNLNKIDEAEIEIQNYEKVEIVRDHGFVNPQDKETVARVFSDTDGDNLFSLPGAIGTLLGQPIKRESLIAFMGPPKRGKTSWLWEMAMQAILNRRKTVVISLEMGERASLRKYYKRLTAYHDSKNTDQKGEEQLFVYPVIDCAHNQNDYCARKERTNIEKRPRRYDPRNSGLYTVCTYCRENHIKEFTPAVWYEQISRKGLNVRNTVKHTKLFSNAYGRNLRFKSYPAFSASLADIMRDLEKLEKVDNFIPDVIIIDYADILKPENVGFSQSERGSIDITWKTLKRISSERKCCVITASQSNRQSINKKNVTQVDAAEDIRKINHVEVMFSINQTKEEKKQLITRLGIIAMREGEFHELEQVTVLQQLELGQTMVDSAWIYEDQISQNEEEDEEEN